MATKTATKKRTTDFFSGRKAKWLALFRRLVARLDRIPGIEITAASRALAIHQTGNSRSAIGSIQVTADGLELSLALQRAAIPSDRLKPSRKSPKRFTHQVLISNASEVDAELLEWLKAAKTRAHIAKRRST